jgi:hypothetical protein
VDNLYNNVAPPKRNMAVVDDVLARTSLALEDDREGLTTDDKNMIAMFNRETLDMATTGPTQ